MKDYYDILGVPRGASQEDIKRAYHILAHQFHPDKNGGNDKRFKEINEAYRVLSGNRTKAEYDARYDYGFIKQDGATSAGTLKAVGKRTWVTWASWVAVVIVVRLIFGDQFSTSHNINGIQTSSTDGAYAQTSPIGNSNPTQEVQDSATPAQNVGTAASQYQTSKCVTESGVLICDLSYQSSDIAGNTRTVTIPGGEVICHDLTTGLNTDTQANTFTISSGPEFCASDDGSVYIDPSINVAKYYGYLTQNIPGNYIVPSSPPQCIWTYVGGSAAIPYIQAGSYTGPESSYGEVHAFCQKGINELDIFTAPSS